MLLIGNKSLSYTVVAFFISTFSSLHLIGRGGKDPAWFFQEELQGPMEATTHADEGGEGQVRPLLSHCKQTHRTACDWPSQLYLFLSVAPAFMCSWCREVVITAKMSGAQNDHSHGDWAADGFAFDAIYAFCAQYYRNMFEHFQISCIFWAPLSQLQASKLLFNVSDIARFYSSLFTQCHRSLYNQLCSPKD